MYAALYVSLRVRTAQAMRAVLLAIATVATFVGRRDRRPMSHGEAVALLVRQRMTARAP
jgi:hypothetical protein